MSKYKLVVENVLNAYILDKENSQIVTLCTTKRPDLGFEKLEQLIEDANRCHEMDEIIARQDDEGKCSCCITASQERAIDNLKAAMYDKVKEIDELSARNRELTEIVNSYKKIANDMINVDIDDYGNYAIEVMNLDEKLERLKLRGLSDD